jgi:hypothetical protein
MVQSRAWVVGALEAEVDVPVRKRRAVALEVGAPLAPSATTAAVRDYTPLPRYVVAVGEVGAAHATVHPARGYKVSTLCLVVTHCPTLPRLRRTC